MGLRVKASQFESLRQKNRHSGALGASLRVALWKSKREKTIGQGQGEVWGEWMEDPRASLDFGDGGGRGDGEKDDSEILSTHQSRRDNALNSRVVG